MLVDMHNHTSLCNHASGTPENYILNAIKKKIQVYGFSEHAPMEFDPKYRMKYEELDLYEKNIKFLAEKYKDQIDIKTGYEVDFIEGKTNINIINRDVDYFIGSVHFVNEWGFDNPKFIGNYKNYDIDELYSLYFLAIEKLAKSKLFNSVGHLDLIKIFNKRAKKDIRILAKNALKAIKKYSLVVEINTAGLRKPVNEQYPSEYLLQEIYEQNIDITLSSDAHSEKDVGMGLEFARDLAKKIGFTRVAYWNKKDICFKSLI